MEVAYPPGLPTMNLDHGTAAVVDDMDIDIGTDLDPVEDLQIEQSVSASSSIQSAALILNVSGVRTARSHLRIKSRH